MSVTAAWPANLSYLFTSGILKKETFLLWKKLSQQSSPQLTFNLCFSFGPPAMEKPEIHCPPAFLCATAVTFRLQDTPGAEVVS